jgi:hypothetical protein
MNDKEFVSVRAHVWHLKLCTAFRRNLITERSLHQKLLGKSTCFLFIFGYLTMFPIAERMWYKAVMDQFHVLSGEFPGVTKKTTTIPSQNIRFQGRDFNTRPPVNLVRDYTKSTATSDGLFVIHILHDAPIDFKEFLDHSYFTKIS